MNVINIANLHFFKIHFFQIYKFRIFQVFLKIKKTQNLTIKLSEKLKTMRKEEIYCFDTEKMKKIFNII